MTLVDANLLLHAYNEASEFHASARRWLEDLLSSPQAVLLPWATLLAFLRISTHRRILERPLTTREASSIVSEWLALPQVVVSLPRTRHWDTLRSVLQDGQVRGAMVTDAHLAALAIDNGAVLATSDRDFARFSGLQTLNPLVEKG